MKLKIRMKIEEITENNRVWRRKQRLTSLCGS
jgi:hypothetical protein